MPLELGHVGRLEAARVSERGEPGERGVLVDVPQSQQRERLRRAAQLPVLGRCAEVLERVAERPGDRDVLVHTGEVLARQRVVQKLLEVMARDAERRGILVGSEPSQRATEIELDLAVQLGRVAPSLALSTANGIR